MTARKIRELTIGDRTYDLYAYPCEERGEDIYMVLHWNGTSVSRFHFDHPSLDDFEDFCRNIDEDFALRRNFDFALWARELIYELREGLHREGLHRNEKSASIRRLLEFGQAAFELGFAVKQDAENKYSDKYYLAGVQIVEARRAGQERARLALSTKGRKTRTAVAKAAEQVRSHRPEIAHNVAAVAREIRKLELPALCRSDGSPISEETICKYLRQARKCKKTENRQENPGSGKTSR